MDMNNRGNNNQNVRNRPLGYDQNTQGNYMNQGNGGGSQPYQNNYQQQQSYNQQQYFQQSPQYYQQPQQQDVLCTLSLILSIISMVCCFISPLISIPALIMAVISIVKTTSQSKTKQIIAITLSVVSLILFIVFLAVNSNKTKEAEVYQPTINEKAYNESSKPKEKVSEPETTIVDDENITEEEPEVNKNETSTKIEYIRVDIQTITDELDANALKAERTYQDMYVEITGKVKSFDSDGKYFSVEALNAGDWNFDSIQVYIANEEQRNILMKCSVGKEVTIQGQITDIGELIGYKMKADKIIADVPENDTSIDLTTNNSGYVEVDVQKLIDDLKNNALLAERTYQDIKVQVTGKISNIDSDGKYISIEALNAGDWNFDTIRCDISNNNQLDVIIEKSKGAEVTIRGQITDIGELLGYVIDIDEIW